jgi:glutamate carboxypeptidase
MDSQSQRSLTAAMAHLAEQRDPMVETLRRWCDQNSGSYHRAGLDAMASILERDFRRLGVSQRRVACEPYVSIDAAGNKIGHESADLLVCEHRPDAPRQILLMIHYDTVYPPDAIPRVCALDDSSGRMVGPGVADAKGGLLVMLEALATIRQFELDGSLGWTMAVNPDEEIGSPGSTKWMREHAKRFDFGLLFEPPLPDGALVSGRKGSGNFDVIVTGRSAHAGRNPGDGRNAMVHLCRLLDQLDQFNHPTSTTTINVAKIDGGSALNRIPDVAVGRFNVRVANPEAEAKFLADINALVGRFDDVEGYSVRLEGHFQSPPKPSDQATRLLAKRVSQAAASIGRTTSWRETGGACDGSKLAAAGLVNIDTLGPNGDGLHSPREWVDTHSLVPAAQTVVALVAQYALETSRTSPP